MITFWAFTLLLSRSPRRARTKSCDPVRARARHSQAKGVTAFACVHVAASCDRRFCGFAIHLHRGPRSGLACDRFFKRPRMLRAQGLGLEGLPLGAPRTFALRATLQTRSPFQRLVHSRTQSSFPSLCFTARSKILFRAPACFEEFRSLSRSAPSRDSLLVFRGFCSSRRRPFLSEGPRSDADLLSKSTFMTHGILSNPILTHHSSHLCSPDSFEPRGHRRPEDPRSRDPFEPRARKPSSRCVMRYLLRGSQPDTNPSFEVRAEQTNPFRDSCSSKRQHPLSRLLAPQLVNDLSIRPRTRCSHE